MLADCTPHFSFRLAEKKNGRCTVQKEKAFRRVASRTARSSKPPAGDGWLAPFWQSGTETPYCSVTEVRVASEESTSASIPARYALLWVLELVPASIDGRRETGDEGREIVMKVD